MANPTVGTPPMQQFPWNPPRSGGFIPPAPKPGTPTVTPIPSGDLGGPWSNWGPTVVVRPGWGPQGDGLPMPVMPGLIGVPGGAPPPTVSPLPIEDVTGPGPITTALPAAPLAVEPTRLDRLASLLALLQGIGVLPAGPSPTVSPGPMPDSMTQVVRPQEPAAPTILSGPGPESTTQVVRPEGPAAAPRFAGLDGLLQRWQQARLARASSTPPATVRPAAGGPLPAAPARMPFGGAPARAPMGAAPSQLVGRPTLGGGVATAPGAAPRPRLSRLV